MTNLILPEHVAKARAKQVKKETKKKVLTPNTHKPTFRSL